MTDAKVIALFKREPEPDEPFCPEDILSDAMQCEMTNVLVAINDLWDATSRADLLRRMAEIKVTVGGWPDDG